MKYLNPEMEIVELDERILTTDTGLASQNGTDNITNPNNGVDMGDAWSKP